MIRTPVDFGNHKNDFIEYEKASNLLKNIIETIDKVIQIHENGRIKRQESEKELQSLEQELKDKLLEINVKKEE